MNYRDLHHIMVEVTEKVICGFCKKKFSLANIHPQKVFEKECVLGVICPHCHSHILLNAHIEYFRDTNRPNYIINESTKLLQNAHDHKPITIHDVRSVPRALKSFSGSFQKIFKNT